MAKRSILVLATEAALKHSIVRVLDDGAFAVSFVGAAAEARREVASRPFAALVLDLDLLNERLLALLRRLRRRDATLPILLLVDSPEQESILDALCAGACDFLLKPVRPLELRARLRLLLGNDGRAFHDVLRFGNLCIDRSRHTAGTDAGPIPLTPTEFRLLEQFMIRPEGLHTRRTLLHNVWGMDFDPGTNLVEVHLSNLRRKLRGRVEAVRLVTVRGLGYRLTSGP